MLDKNALIKNCTFRGGGGGVKGRAYKPKASKAWSDRRYTDVCITVERFDRLVIFEND